MGYGEFDKVNPFSPKKNQLNLRRTASAGDIAATSDGERVGFLNLDLITIEHILISVFRCFVPSCFCVLPRSLAPS